MEPTPKSSHPVIVAVTRVALGVLVLFVGAGEVLVIGYARELADRYPEFAHLHGPLVFAAIAFGVCTGIVLTVTAVLVGFTRDARIFRRGSLRLVDLLIGALASATITVIAVLFAIPGPPALALLLLAGVLAGAALVLVLTVLRSLLRNAAFMRVELDEVV